MDDYFELIRKRQSCRSFADKPVEKEKIVRCVEAARLAPSACNGQPWKFYIVNGGSLREKAVKCGQKMGINGWTKSCPAFAAIVLQGADIRNISGRACDSKWGQFDLGLATMQFCLAATAQGLSTCIIGAFDENRTKDVMKIPRGQKVGALIAIGYAADEKIREKSRRDLGDILKFVE